MEETLQRVRSFRPVKSRSGAMGPGRRDLMCRLLESAMKVTEARRGLVVETDPDGGCRSDILVGDWPSHSLAARFAASFGRVGMLDARASRVTAGTPSHRLHVGRGSVVEMGQGGAACVPLWTAGRMLGLMYLGGRKPGSRLTTFEVQFLEALGQHAALVLASFRLRGRIHQLVRELRAAGAAPDRRVPSEVRRRFAVSVPKDDRAPVAEGGCRAL